MWLLAGLGNPGSRYEDTPHNLGFEVVMLLARRHGLRWGPSRQARAEVATGEIAGTPVALMMPTTYMNLSGEAVVPFAKYYKIDAENILTVTDDVALPWGKVRMRVKGSHGGHNGLRNIIALLGTDAFPRLRIGCEPVGWQGDLASYVLAKLRGDARELATHMTEIAADAVEKSLKVGFEKAQGQFNGYDALKAAD